MHPARPLTGLLLILLASALEAASPSLVPEKWHTPFGLYLSPREAHELKQANPDTVSFIDVRTRGEVKYIGMADAVDAHIPVRFLRDDYAWSKKSSTYRTRSNPDFVAAVERLLAARKLSRNDPIILMCQSGSRVPAAAKQLHKAGFTRVYTQHEGFEGVKAKSGPNAGQRVVNG